MQATAIITANEGKISRFLPEINKQEAFFLIHVVFWDSVKHTFIQV